MFDLRLLATILVLSTATLSAADPALAPVQDSTVEVGGSGVAEPVGRLLATQGGQERVEALVGFDFSLVDVTIEPPEQEDGEAVERPRPPIRVSVGIDPSERRVRMEERLDLGQGEVELVRVAAPDGLRVAIDGIDRPSQQLALEGRAQAAELLLVLDLQWGVLLGQVIASADAPRTRDGVEYDCLQARFGEGRGIADPFRLYLDRQSGLVRRVDQFDVADRRRKATLLFDEFVVVDGFSLPTRVQFLDRERIVRRRWELDFQAVDPDWPADHFAVQ